jgi:hypothetical protein
MFSILKAAYEKCQYIAFLPETETATETETETES